jgi:hypothetical protein
MWVRIFRFGKESEKVFDRGVKTRIGLFASSLSSENKRYQGYCGDQS